MKKFIIPECEIIDFTNEDIITSSGDGSFGSACQDTDINSSIFC